MKTTASSSLDRASSHSSSRGGRFEKFEAIYEMVDTLYSTRRPMSLLASSPHVRDAIDLKRVMITGGIRRRRPCAV